MSQSVPLIDMADWSHPDRRRGFISTLGEALERFGFVRVRGHVVDAELIERAYDERARGLEAETARLRAFSAESEGRVTALQQRVSELEAQLRSGAAENASLVSERASLAAEKSSLAAENRSRSPEIGRRGPEIARDCARSTEIARRGPRRGGWVGSEGAQVCSAVDGQLGAREPDL